MRGWIRLAAAGSFLVPSEWFLLINPAHTEIVKLQDIQATLKDSLANAQEKRDEAERLVLLAKSDLDVYQNVLMRLARQQVSIREVSNPFDGMPSSSAMLNDVREEAVVEAKGGIEKQMGPESTFLLELMDQARGQLQDYANGNESIFAALQKFDDVQRELTTPQSDLNRFRIEIVSIEEKIRVATARVHDIMRQSTNQYLAMRAGALGALGAFAATLAAFLHGAASDARLQHGRVMLSMAFGSIVALVVFALFTTRELSVFASDGATPDEMPDYWRVVILCLIAGAFADRLFAAAREHVDRVARGQGKTGASTPSPKPTTADSAAPAPPPSATSPPAS